MDIVQGNKVIYKGKIYVEERTGCTREDAICFNHFLVLRSTPMLTVDPKQATLIDDHVKMPQQSRFNLNSNTVISTLPQQNDLEPQQPEDRATITNSDGVIAPAADFERINTNVEASIDRKSSPDFDARV